MKRAFILLLATLTGTYLALAAGQEHDADVHEGEQTDSHAGHPPSPEGYGEARDHDAEPHATEQADSHAGHPPSPEGYGEARDHDAEPHAAEQADSHAGHPPSPEGYGEARDHDAEPHATEQVDSHAGHDHEADEEGIRLSPDVMNEFGIQTAEAGPGALQIQTALPGEVQVDGDQVAHIVPRYAGLAVEVRKKIGDVVKKGDVLAVIEGNESLAPYELKSLIGGTIIEKHIALGESLGEDAVVFTIANLDTVWVALTVFQRDLKEVHKGQAVRITSDEAAAQGTISYVSPTLDAHTRTALARVVLNNPEGLWRPGMFVTGQVTVGAGERAIVIPSSAVQNLDGESVVFVPGGNGFVPRPVTTGRDSRDQVEVLAGLEAGETYVAVGAFHLKAELITSGLDAHAGHGH